MKQHGGLAVAAHVDRRAFGVVAQLGFFPRDAGFDAVEVSWRVRDAAQLAALEAYGHRAAADPVRTATSSTTSAGARSRS